MNTVAKFVSSIFGNNDEPAETLDDVLTINSNLINSVVDSIINQFLAKTNNGEYLLELMDPIICNNVGIYLSDNFEAHFNKLNITDDILVSKMSHKPCATPQSCSKIIDETVVRENPKLTKGDVCSIIASHYIKLLNVIASLLIAISPDKNMCIERMNSIYKVVDSPTGNQAFDISICKKKTSVKDRLFDEIGLRELINLYILDHMDKVMSPDDILTNEQAFKELVNFFNESHMLDRPILQRPARPPKKEIAPVESLAIQKGDVSVKSKSTIKPVINIVNTQILKNNSNKSPASTKSPASNKSPVLVENKPKQPINAIQHASLPSDVVKLADKNNSGLVGSVSGSSSATSTSKSSSKLENITDNYSMNNANNSSGTGSSSSSTSSTSSASSDSSDNNIPIIEIIPGSSSSSSSSKQTAGSGADDSIQKFNKFINTYKKYWSPEIRAKFHDIVNNKFKTDAGFISEICELPEHKNKEIIMDLDEIDVAESAGEQSLKRFYDNFEQMKTEYLNYCDQIIKLLKTEILDITRDTSSKHEKYNLKTLSSTELKIVQQNSRTILRNMYVSNHKLYLESLEHLNTYYKSAFYKKQKASTTPKSKSK